MALKSCLVSISELRNPFSEACNSWLIEFPTNKLTISKDKKWGHFTESSTRCQDAQKVLSSAWPVPTVLAALDLSEVNPPHQKMGKLRTSADFRSRVLQIFVNKVVFLIRDIAMQVWLTPKQKNSESFRSEWRCRRKAVMQLRTNERPWHQQDLFNRNLDLKKKHLHHLQFPHLGCRHYQPIRNSNIHWCCWFKSLGSSAITCQEDRTNGSDQGPWCFMEVSNAL